MHHIFSILTIYLQMSWHFAMKTPTRDLISEQRIIGGQVVSRLDLFPFQVSFNATNEVTGSGFFCSGALIAQKTILTAGHCLVNATLISIRLGSLHYSTGGHLQSSRSFRIHPHYNSTTLRHDIALLYLPDAVTSASTCHTSPAIICLPDKSTIPFHHSTNLWNRSTWWWLYYCRGLLVAGWGQTAFTSHSLSPTLQSITVLPVPIRQCEEVYRRHLAPSQLTVNLVRFEVPGEILCASAPGRFVCLGDSGSPLISTIFDMHSQRPTLLGITSTTFECGRNGVPDIYTRVDAYLEWIRAFSK